MVRFEFQVELQSPTILYDGVELKKVWRESTLDDLRLCPLTEREAEFQRGKKTCPATCFVSQYAVIWFFWFSSLNLSQQSFE